MPEDLEVQLGLDASKYLDGVEDVGRANESLFKNMGRLANDAAGYIRRAYSMMDRLDMANISVTQSVERVERAQSAYNAAIAEFGQNSEQATRAHKELEQAEDAQERAEKRLHQSQMLVIADVATLAGKLPKTISNMRALAAAENAAAASGTAMAGSHAAMAAYAGPAAAGVAAVAGSFWLYKENLKAANDEQHIFNEIYNAVGGKIASAVPRWDGPKWLQSAGGDGVTDLLREQEAVIKDVTASNILLIQDFIAGEQRKADVVAGSEAAIRAELAQTQADMATVVEDMVGAQTRQEFDAYGRRWQTLNAEAVAYQQQLDIITQTSQANFMAQVSTLRGDLQGLGLDVAAMSPTLIASLSELNPAFAELANQIGGVRARELELARHILASGNPALIEQLNITKGKAESSEDLAAALGITVEQERALEQQGIITTNVLGAQSSAMAGGAINANPLGSRAAGANGWEYTNSGGGQQQYMGLAGFIGENKQAVIEAFLGRRNPKGVQMDVDGVASALSGGSNGIGIPGVGMWVGDVGDERRKKMVGVLSNLITQKAPSTVWDSLLSQLGVSGFAHGVDGVIKRPGLFMAGEHGAESIQVRPLSQREKRQDSGSTVVFQPGAIVVQGGKADDLMRQLRRLGLQA